MRILGIFLLIVGVVACEKPTTPSLKVGTIAGSESELVEVAKKVALDEYGLTVHVIEFNDYNLPNEALADGSLDANVYQHLPYLQASMQAHGYAFKSLGRTFIYPMGIYSKKFKSMRELPNKAVIAIPNDPSNEARALLLLQKSGLIRLKNTPLPSLSDLVSNPKQITIKELDAAQLPRILDDVDAALINTTFALPAGLTPANDAIYLEGSDSPYANLIVVRQNNNKKEQLEEFVKAMQSKPVQEKAKQLFGDAALVAW